MNVACTPPLFIHLLNLKENCVLLVEILWEILLDDCFATLLTRSGKGDSHISFQAHNREK